MRPAAASMSSSLGRSRNAMVFGLSSATARPAGVVASAMRNSCASERAGESAAKTVNATATGIRLRMTSCLSVVSPVTPDIAGVDALRGLVLATVRIARRRRLVARVAHVRVGLPVIRPGRALIARGSGNVAPAVVVVIVLVAAALVIIIVAAAVAERIGVGRHGVIAALDLGALARDQIVLGIDHPSVAVEPVAFGDALAAALRLARLRLGRPAAELAPP